MKFHSEFDIKKLEPPIDHLQRLFLIGSCFTENIGEKLKKYKFRVLENPHGILFNPVSVAEAITDYIENKIYTTQDLFQLNEGWHSWKHHSRFSDITAGDTLNKINQSIQTAQAYLKQSDYILITLGSAWVYTLTEEAGNNHGGTIAANNHKAPASWFNRKLLTNDDVLRALDSMLQRLFSFNSNIRVIFTISPVRHLREGVIANNRSKAVLIQAVHHLVDKYEKLYYFPAYELVIDDLRDYRFYSEDLVHPNYAATQYVWEKFTASCMEEKTQKLMNEIGLINLAFQHKPFNPTSAQHRNFLSTYYERTCLLKDQYPHLDLEKEIVYFNQH
jgi:hypothetical protein